MTLSGFIWGILADSAGRKNILIIIFGSDTIITIMTAMAQNLNLLIACKFLSGIMLVYLFIYLLILYVYLFNNNLFIYLVTVAELQ